MKRLLPLATALLLCQCAEEAETNKVASESAQPSTMNDRFNNRSKQGYVQDSEGNWKIQNDKRSSFESQGQSNLANRQYSGKAYNATSVSKKSWWGDTTHQRPAYTGNTSADHLVTTAPDAAKGAREGGLRSLFSRKSVSTTRIASTSARENSTAGINRTTAVQNTSNRSSLEQSTVMDYRAQRALEIKDTKSLLRKE